MVATGVVPGAPREQPGVAHGGVEPNIEPNVEPMLVVDQRGTECRITLNRPQKHNPLSRSLLDELGAAIARAGSDPATNYILLCGAGERYFAAGGDLRDLAAVRSESETLEMVTAARDALDTVRRSHCQVIAYLNGDAIGGGAELAVACDLRLMAPHAHIGFVQSRLAITSAWGGGPDLCALVGASRALRMMARAELIDAGTALNWGLADAVVADGPDGEDAGRFLGPFRKLPRDLLFALKEQTAAWRFGQPYDERRALEQRAIVASWTHPNHWDAVERLLSRPSTVTEQK